MELHEAFEYVIQELNMTVDWSETDGRDIKEILEAFFDDIPKHRAEIKMLFDNHLEFRQSEKKFVFEMLDECK